MKRLIVFSLMLLLPAVPFSVSLAQEPDSQMQECLKVCNDVMAQTVKDCDEMYDISKEFQEHTQCLSDAQEEQAACQEQCQENDAK